jgi:hypothetical protein
LYTQSLHITSQSLNPKLQAIGVLDGTATAEPILFYMEADNLTMVMEKCLYRWESAYNGKLVGGSLVRDVLTCVYASRLGLRRSELLEMLQLSTAQVTSDKTVKNRNTKKLKY